MQADVILAPTGFFIYLFFDVKIRWPADAFISIDDAKKEGDDSATPRQSDRNLPLIFSSSSSFFFLNDLFIISVEL